MGNRIAYYTNESFATRIDGVMLYQLAQVTENEAGYTVHTTDCDLWYLQGVADALNTKNGISRDDVLAIVASSMWQGSVRR